MDNIVGFVFVEWIQLSWDGSIFGNGMGKLCRRGDHV